MRDKMDHMDELLPHLVDDPRYREARLRRVRQLQNVVVGLVAPNGVGSSREIWLSGCRLGGIDGHDPHTGGPCPEWIPAAEWIPVEQIYDDGLPFAGRPIIAYAHPAVAERMMVGAEDVWTLGLRDWGEDWPRYQDTLGWTNPHPIAQRPGSCPQCGQAIHPGQEIAPGDGPKIWLHLGCRRTINPAYQPPRPGPRALSPTPERARLVLGVQVFSGVGPDWVYISPITTPGRVLITTTHRVEVQRCRTDVEEFSSPPGESFQARDRAGIRAQALAWAREFGLPIQDNAGVFADVPDGQDLPF